MPHYEINILGNDLDKELVFLTNEPDGLNGFGFRLAEGDSAQDIYPSDARVYIDPLDVGVRLCSLLGNTFGYLVVNGAFKQTVETCNVAPIEFFPLSIYSQKRRLYSPDYWIINPLAIVDCVDRSASKINFSQANSSAIVGIEELVFDSRKLTNAPDLFRIPEQRMGYFASERLLQALAKLGVDNVLVNEIKELS